MKHWTLFLFLILASPFSYGDDLDALDAMLDSEESIDEVSLDLAMDVETTESRGKDRAENEFRLYRENRDVQFNFKGVKKNLIKWDEINPDGWLGLDAWKKARVRKDQEPEWKLNLIERNLRELVGRFLECVGDCRIYRGEGFSTSQYKSRVRELDEIITQQNSYAWIAMADGTMVRLSPNTSVSFKEINIGKKENFLHIRINSGNLLVLNRVKHKYKIRNLRETDKVFLPLGLNDANPEEVKIKLNEDDLSNFIEENTTVQKHYKKLNTYIESNNDLIEGKETHTMVVMPNGTVFGKNMQAEFVVLLGGESYVKQRTFKEQFMDLEEESEPEAELDYYYRGFENKDKFTLEPGNWYRVGIKGKSIVPHSDPQLFRVGEYLTSNIPSILLAREILVEEKSEFIFKTGISRKDLAENGGYRLWGEIDKKGDDLNLRIRFLKEYTRRIETTNLVVARQFKRRASDRGELTKSMIYDSSFYDRALRDYIVSRDSEIIVDTDREVLNSTKKLFWKIINEKKRK
ncbi:MAG: hypothetical protein CME70_10650 [Halobacteriovorax sp.]|nr:hypothetical protein [Halobacteriovorax sp.]|tara:strand:- start:92279 stop:93835 length:1557 start_codon:yes stop_codon:yes gene_type:complete